ncbi:MAG TPA: error-prone DNA polymerase [Gammaproteobacteria bacterium]|nr:error-prone DNA polymerase [Gammaproteobacteria bacterium]
MQAAVKKIRNVPYAELHCITSFSFLRGASQPEELVARAAGLGYAALAITDECSLAGVVRAHTAAKERGLKLIIGSELHLSDGPHLVVLAPDRPAYGRLSELITAARRAAPKGEYALTTADVADGLPGCLVLWVPPREDPERDGRRLAGIFGDRLWIAVELLAEGDDRRRRLELERLGGALGLPCVASGDVHMHVRGRRALQDVLTAIRLKTTLHEAGFALHASGERHLRSRARLKRIYPAALLDASVAIAARCTFSLDDLRYEYPREVVPEGETPAGYLRRLTEEGARQRWPDGVPATVRRLIEHELELIGDLAYEPYFLTVHDIVRFARSRGILCQGRGSAANSAVCYCLGITAVDPARMSLLMERFISRERNEPPDIDVDFEHDRREEVIQYLYARYGRDRAALAATVICYRPRSAVRDVGKALGLAAAQIERLARATQWWDGARVDGARIREAGLDPASPVIARLVALVECLIGFPRHLSQHVGGFVISAGPLPQLVPVENAAMPERTVIQWDKDDLEDLGLLKVDVLGLGMLSAIRRSFELVRGFSGRELTLAGVPAEDPAVYDMICAADTVGVFQIESRAQMSMLPRLKPRSYYDLVIEVAIVRPGPIQGDMVHPYLRRRSREEPVDYPSEAVRGVLERTLGVPIFQEQVMHLAMVAAGFTAGEADSLRRAMAAWRRRGSLGHFEDKLIRGMRERGYPREYAERIFRQIQGFGEYGFPESHAASFALLVYVSAWLKRHEPAAFFAALLNSQPMGFYAPAQLVGAARRAGVEVRATDVRVSAWESTLERRDDGAAALRLGLRVIRGFGEAAAGRLVAARTGGAFTGTQDLAERAGLDRGELGALAAAGALASLAGHRHRARWAVAGVEPPTRLLPRIVMAEGEPMLARPSEGEDIVADYSSTGLTLRRHPLALLRERLTAKGIVGAARLWQLPNGEQVHAAGLVITRQRPGTAGGVTFVTLEDESGHVNLIVWRTVAARQRRALLGARLLGVHGRLQREGEVLHVIAERLEDLSGLLGGLVAPARDFR